MKLVELQRLEPEDFRAALAPFADVEPRKAVRLDDKEFIYLTTVLQAQGQWPAADVNLFVHAGSYRAVLFMAVQRNGATEHVKVTMDADVVDRNTFKYASDNPGSRRTLVQRAITLAGLNL